MFWGGLKFCWNKNQQWLRAAVELWLFRHSVNRCATLCPLSLYVKLFEKYFNRVCAVTFLNNVQMASLYCVALNYYVPVSHINPRKTLNFMNSLHSTHLHSASGFVFCMLVTLGKRSNCYTGRFIMFSVITNIYNNKTKGSTLMELFIATRKLKKKILTTRDVRCLDHSWHGTHRYDIQVLATHASTWVHRYRAFRHGSVQQWRTSMHPC
jgi:hypothetical protein